MLLGGVEADSLQRLTRHLFAADVAMEDLLVAGVSGLDEDVVDHAGEWRSLIRAS